MCRDRLRRGVGVDEKRTTDREAPSEGERSRVSCVEWNPFPSCKRHG